MSLDDKFEIPNSKNSNTKNTNIEILYFDRVNPKIFVAVVCNFEYLYRMLFYILFGKVYTPPKPFIEKECAELKITPETKLCLNNGVVHKFLHKWCSINSPNNELLQNIFINVIPVPSITYRV